MEWYDGQVNYMYRTLLLSAVFLSIAALFPLSVFAQGAGITVVPTTVEEPADPGDTITETLEITNESGEDKEYYIYKKDIIGVEEGGVPIFAQENVEKTGYEISEWVEIATDPIKIPAYGKFEIPFTIHVPDTASPGSHFGGIFVSVEPPKLRETGAGVGYEVATILSIRISGDIIDDARIRSFSTDKLFYGSKHVKFDAKVENRGNILIRPYGPLTITSMFGGKPVNISINDSLAGVFPGTVRDLEFSWDEEGLGFGRYEAVLALLYEGKEGQKTIDASLVFWVFPGKVMLGVLGGFLAILLGGYFLTRFYINQAVMRAAGGRRLSPQRYRKQVGVSRFTFVMVALLILIVLFLIVLLIFFA